MSFQIRYNAASRMVRVCFFGRTGAAARMAVAKLLAEKYRHLEPLRILVDVRFAQTAMSPSEQRQFGRYLAKHPVLGRAVMAVLHSKGFYPSLLIANEARALGHGMRSFIVEAEALNWLRRRRAL
ncbi:MULTISPECIES: hypothetical protein [unclassified Microbulbifer]|uniref:hypothetical protein n=1 Tax=unclassified Microbulbifer TaxID=2619833 RepID=UPI0027E43D69|nr:MULTISPECIES: hypothetical protein [unclassified Microbulbifer]